MVEFVSVCVIVGAVTLELSAAGTEVRIGAVAVLSTAVQRQLRSEWWE